MCMYVCVCVCVRSSTPPTALNAETSSGTWLMEEKVREFERTIGRFEALGDNLRQTVVGGGASWTVTAGQGKEEEEQGVETDGGGNKIRNRNRKRAANRSWLCWAHCRAGEQSHHSEVSVMHKVLVHIIAKASVCCLHSSA